LFNIQDFLDLADDDEVGALSGSKRHRIGEISAEGAEVIQRKREALKRNFLWQLYSILLALSHEANALLYLECYQFVLCKQVEAFIQLGLPNELEVDLG
jgi:hypothetical protein